jgi:hypothetical protein
MWANRYLPDSGWQGLERVSAEGTFVLSDNYQVEINDNGDFVLVWETSDTRFVTQTVSSRVYLDDSGWTDSISLDFRIGTSHLPQVDINNSAEVYAVWAFVRNSGSNNDEYSGVYYRKFNVITEWSDLASIDVEEVEEFPDVPQQPNISINDSGEAIAVWRRNKEVQISFYEENFSNASNWQPSVSIGLGEDSSVVGFPAAEIEMDDMGNVIAAWSNATTDNSYARIFTNQYDTNTGWAGPTQVQSDLLERSSGTKPQLELNDTHAVLLWYSGANGPNVFASVMPIGGTWSDEITVENSDLSAGITTPQLLLTESGDISVLYSQDVFVESLSRYNQRIFVNQFSVNEQADSDAAFYLPQTEALSEAYAPAAGIDNSGRIIVVSTRLFSNSLAIQAHVIEPDEE